MFYKACSKPVIVRSITHKLALDLYGFFVGFFVVYAILFQPAIIISLLEKEAMVPQSFQLQGNLIMKKTRNSVWLLKQQIRKTYAIKVEPFLRSMCLM